MITILKNYSMKVSPEDAERMLTETKYKGQRRIQPARVNLYAQKMVDGHWVPGSPMKFGVVGKKDSARQCIDGQHRLRAIVESKTTQEFAVTEILCSDDAELARLYYTTDRGMGRSYDAIFSATGIKDELGLTHTMMNRAIAAVRFIMGNFVIGNPAVDEEVLLTTFLEYKDAVTLYNIAIAGCDSKMATGLARAAVMSVGFVTFRYAANIYGERKIDEFWEGIAVDDGLKNSDPRKVAHLHIRDTRMPNAQLTKGEVVSSAHQARYVAHCFNAWVSGATYKIPAGRTRGTSKVIDPSAPIRILGTPWKG